MNLPLLRQYGMVHPHACGEYVRFIILDREPQRSIPTPVGNTSLDYTTPSWSSVHPHACGEYKLSVIDRTRLYQG